MCEPERALVLVGVTGDGKSSTGNTLAGREVFEVSAGLSSETSRCAHADFICSAGLYRVVDTVGLHDTNLRAEEVLTRFSEFAELTPCGIDAFLFVVRWGRFKPEHEAALAAFEANCGASALERTLLVFTHCGARGPRERDELRRALREDAPTPLRDWAARLAGAVAVDNVVAATDGRGALLEAVDELLGSVGGAYSNEALADAQRARDAKAEEERAAFAAAVADWRKGSGPVVIEREYAQAEAPTV